MRCVSWGSESIGYQTCGPREVGFGNIGEMESGESEHMVERGGNVAEEWGWGGLGTWCPEEEGV